MRRHVIRDQPTILRILVENGMDGQVKPTDPTKPGVIALFPEAGTDITDLTATGRYYIIDKVGDTYHMLVMEGYTFPVAYRLYEHYAKQHASGSPTVTIKPQHVPYNN